MVMPGAAPPRFGSLDEMSAKCEPCGSHANAVTGSTERERKVSNDERAALRRMHTDLSTR